MFKIHRYLSLISNNATVDPDDDTVGKLIVKVRMLRTDADLKLKKDNFGERKRKYKMNKFGGKKKKNDEKSQNSKN